ncbi:hypothetical protein AA313_de0205876 [Arthrobotrys entomopaga]|nr:hypothetical protein AA313_de0205876 [Arthrobotrys entomopaga]
MKHPPKLNQVFVELRTYSGQVSHGLFPSEITSIFYQPAQSTLKHLHINTAYLHRIGAGARYPTVEKLRVNVQERRSMMPIYRELCRKFPNVRYLRMDTQYTKINIPITRSLRQVDAIAPFLMDLARFKRLKVAMLPLPKQTRLSDMDEKMLEEALHAFTGGLDELEYLDFWGEGYKYGARRARIAQVYRISRYGPREGLINF